MTEQMIIASGTETNKNIIIDMQQLKGEEKADKQDKCKVYAMGPTRIMQLAYLESLYKQQSLIAGT